MPYSVIVLILYINLFKLSWVRKCIFFFKEYRAFKYEKLADTFFFFCQILHGGVTALFQT